MSTKTTRNINSAMCSYMNTSAERCEERIRERHGVSKQKCPKSFDGGRKDHRIA